jgi:hypothetical protein
MLTVANWEVDYTGSVLLVSFFGTCSVKRPETRVNTEEGPNKYRRNHLRDRIYGTIMPRNINSIVGDNTNLWHRNDMVLSKGFAPTGQ